MPFQASAKLSPVTDFGSHTMLGSVASLSGLNAVDSMKISG